MEVKDLSIQTKEDLSHALEKLTLNWEELMRSNTFASIYSENDINKIRMTGFCPANALIEDIISREIPLKVLLRGLLEIGNRKAISIIEKGTLLVWPALEQCGNDRFRILIASVNLI